MLLLVISRPSALTERRYSVLQRSYYTNYRKRSDLMLPPNQIQQLVENSISFIGRYSAIMILSPDVVYSGTFVNCFGYVGILTAGHCASALMESSEFYLVIRKQTLIIWESMHRLEVQPKQLFHLRIGHNEAEGYALSEPDLSFLIIKDRRILNELIANSWFSYDMSKLKIGDTGLVEGRFSRNNWMIVGNAAEDTKTRTFVMNGHPEKFVSWIIVY